MLVSLFSFAGGLTHANLIFTMLVARKYGLMLTNSWELILHIGSWNYIRKDNKKKILCFHIKTCFEVKIIAIMVQQWSYDTGVVLDGNSIW